MPEPLSNQSGAEQELPQYIEMPAERQRGRGVSQHL